MTTVLGVPLGDLPRWLGSLDQIAGIQSFVESEGPGRGARRLRLITGSGLEVDLHPDRALDIGQVTYRGTPLAWISPTGMTTPAFHTDAPTGWLRAFGGGLLATCGLDTFGPPSTSGGANYIMHGRIGTQPARIVRAGIEDDALVVVADVKQAVLFGENLSLRRTIVAPVGESRLFLSDTVTNEGFRDAGHMILYHCNLGWPLVSDAVSVSIPASSVRHHDGLPVADDWRAMPLPTPGFQEQVYCHSGFRGSAEVIVDNRETDLRLVMRFDAQDLPALFQWKMAAEGEYVLGIEPANTAVMGRGPAEELYELPVLPPKSSRTYELEFEFSVSANR